jgi:hypothetical protein
MLQPPVSLTAYPRDLLLNRLPELFPGIDRVVLLYLNDREETDGKELVQAGGQYRIKPLKTEGLDGQLLRMRSEQMGYSWLHKDQLPFEPKSHETRQQLLFSEQFHIVLMLRLTPADPSGLDVFYLFFREDQSNFGISRLQGTLDTARKALVGSLAFRFASVLYGSIGDWQATFKKFTNVTKLLLTVKPEDPDKTLFQGWVLQWAEEFLEGLSQSDQLHYKLSLEALSKLMECGDFRAASEALKQAASYARLLYSDQNSGEILIEGNFLLLEAKTKPGRLKESLNQPVPDRLNKTMAFLDSLEKAATKLMEVGNGITSSGVGQSMDRPISAPAITDALRKNERRVMVLLENNPDRWPVIRHQFKPLLNLVEKKEALRRIG